MYHLTNTSAGKCDKWLVYNEYNIIIIISYHDWQFTSSRSGRLPLSPVGDEGSPEGARCWWRLRDALSDSAVGVMTNCGHGATAELAALRARALLALNPLPFVLADA